MEVFLLEVIWVNCLPVRNPSLTLGIVGGCIVGGSLTLGIVDGDIIGIRVKEYLSFEKPCIVRRLQDDCMELL